jgi:serine/threonine protein kinase/tetratricopeptide (TPR) repeat protein
VDHQRWKEIEALYLAALDAPDQRSFVEEACQGDADLLQEVEQLLTQEPGTVRLFDRLMSRALSGEAASSTHTFLAIGSALGVYRIFELLGSGGSSDVYKAFDTRLDRFVALKVFTHATLTDDFRDRFVREAKAAASLNHPNIATVYEVGQDESHWYIAMEYVDGVTLREKLEDPECSISERLGYLTQAADALARAHSRRIVHCDLKPENIMLGPDGLVKVLDFGLARLVHASPSHSSSITPAAVDEPAVEQPRPRIEGTIGYMSPEQVAGQEVGLRSDVFAFGCMLFEAAANRLPFWSESLVGSLYSLMNEPPPRLEAFTSDAPVGLQELVDECLAKDPAARLPSMEDVSERLQTIAQPRPLAVGRLQWGAVALLAAALGGFSYWQWSTQPEAASVAVLPFVNAQSTPEGAVLAEGISEGLINALTQLPDLKVIARSSSFRFPGNAPDVQSIARTLGVRTLVTGRVAESDGRLRVTAELVNGADGTALWGAEYSGPVADLSDIQAQIENEVARRVRSSGLTPLDQRILAKTIHPNPDVNSLLLRGRYQMSLYTPESTQKAASYFEQALGIDQGYAVANAELANVYRRLGGAGIFKPGEALPLAEQAALKAIAADDELPAAHTVLADIKRDHWEWAAANREYRRAIQLSSSYVPAHQGLAISLSVMGQADAAVAELSRVLDLDPIGLSSAIDSAAVFYNVRRFDRALELLNRTTRRDPQAPAVWMWIGLVTGGSGDFTGALAAFDKAIQRGDNTTATMCYYIHALARSGQRDEALRRLDTLERGAAFVPPSSLAIAYAGLGDRDRAIGRLQAGFTARDPLLQYIVVEPFLDSLKSDSRFQAIVTGMGLSLTSQP